MTKSSCSLEYHSNRFVRGLFLGAALLLAIAFARADDAGTFRLTETVLKLKQVDVDPALSTDQLGYPRLDPSKLSRDNPKIVEREHRAILLENQWIRVTLLPEMGKVYSFVFKVTGHEQLWINPVAKPLTGQSNDVGWWMIWGGVEYTLPRGEHGTTWALPWRYEIAENNSHRKAVRMTVREPATQLEETVEIAIEPGAAWYEAAISIRNIGRSEAKFSHWTNPMWAPGGRNEVTPETEMIVPARWMRVADKPFNRWMLGERLQEFERNPLRWVKHWRDIGDLLAEELTAGFYSAFSHDANEGVVRIFDPAITPGMDIWTWGYPVPPERQREYSLVPNAGYVEMWGGTARDFSDASRGTLAPGAELRWKEWMYPYHGTRGLTFANRELALLFKLDRDRRLVHVGIASTSRRDGAEVRIESRGNVLFHAKTDLAPNRPFHNELALKLPEGIRAEDLWLVIEQGGAELVRQTARPVAELQWGPPYLPRM